MSYSIAVRGVSKEFQIGKLQQGTMLRERLAGLFARPFAKGREATRSMWALRDVSFDITQGEVVGIIGRNGAGKSTLLKVLAKITHPTAGTVDVRGRTAALLEVGTGFHEELTGRENVYLNGSILGMRKREVDAKLDQIVEFSGVEQFIDTPIKRYSSGMRLRLGFAVAAHLDPDILIIDEVLAVGDSGFQKKCLNVMGDLRRAGRTVLFVSHNMAAVENLCSRAIWIDGGKVRQDGPARETIQTYMGTMADKSGTADLASLEHRGGTGDIRYTQLEVLDQARQPKPVIQSGDSIVLRFHYKVQTTVPHPSFGFRLYTEHGTLVTDTATTHHGLEIGVLPPGDGFVDLEISLLNLLPSRYYLSLWITTSDGGVVFDAVEHRAFFDVELANVYGSGRPIDGRFGVVYFPQRWNLAGVRARSLRSIAS